MAAGVTNSELVRASFVGQQHLDGSITGTTTLPLAATGAQAGDYCLVFTYWQNTDPYPTITGGSGGWSRDNYTWTPDFGYKNTTLHKKLTALDLSSTVQLANTLLSGVVPMIGIVVYRNPNSAVRRTIYYDDNGLTTSSTPGFTKSYTCIGVVAYIVDRDVTVNISAAIAGGVIVERADFQSGVAFGQASIADALGKTDYPDGATINWTGLANDGPYAQVSQLYELLI